MKRIVPILLLMLLLTGCVNSIKQIQKNFTNAGYTYSDDAQNYINTLLEEFNEGDVSVTTHVFKLKEGLVTNVAIVLEFKTTKQMNEQIEKSETLKGFIEDLSKSKYVRGNCILIPLLPISETTEEMVNIFQK